MPAVVYFKNFEFFSLMKDIKLLHQRVFLPDLFCFVFSTLRGLVLTLPSMPSRWRDTCQRTSSPSSTKCGNLWCRLLLSMPSWLWSPSTPSCWWWRSVFSPTNEACDSSLQTPLRQRKWCIGSAIVMEFPIWYNRLLKYQKGLQEMFL